MQLEPGEIDVPPREIAFQLGDLDKGQDDRVVGCRRQTVLFGTLDDPLAGDELLPTLVVNLILKFDALLAAWNPVGKKGDGEFCEVHLVLAGWQEGR